MKINNVIISSVRNLTFNSNNTQLEVITNIKSDILIVITDLLSDYKIEIDNKEYIANVERVYYVPCRNGLLQVIFNIKEMK